ncbi:MAG: serine/threonine protein kinase, partial [Vicinamibacteria bacterium]|nr:serine/threonine protein kinase [Vicinamibacteria bacterium]
EVYRAKDTRLGRDVAVKVLPSSLAQDADRLRRFELEARAASSLDHPHVAAIHDIGTHEGTPYIVSELLEGDTLRDRLGTPLPPRRVVEYALQIAQGLSAAHEKGIVHRDLKPENLFVTRDGRIKILDFGLAKLTQPSFGGGVETGAPTMTRGTDPGTVMGTVGYMSPEQVRGRVIDHRSDIFAFGAILYEMLTGRRAFKGDTTADTMTAILKEEPPEISATQPLVPPALDRIVRHCLEKDAESRFQSARDLAFDLEALSVMSAERVAVTGGLSRRRTWVGVAVLAAIALAALGYLAGRRATSTTSGSGVTSLPSFHRLTYRRGTIRSARFAPDGQTIVYGAAWEGQPIRLFMTRAQGGESTPIALPDAEILSISTSGEMAVSVGHSFESGVMGQGTLARAGLLGGTPREVLENVEEAEWTPDGADYAVVRRLANRERLEYPVNHVLRETDGYISHPRFSRRGDRIAFLTHPILGDDRGWVSVVDLAGHEARLTAEYTSIGGVAWSPGGDEIWFSASKSGEAYSLLGVSLAGRERVVWRGLTGVSLMDVAKDGRALLCGRGPA